MDSDQSVWSSPTAATQHTQYPTSWDVMSQLSGDMECGHKILRPQSTIKRLNVQWMCGESWLVIKDSNFSNLTHCQGLRIPGLTGLHLGGFFINIWGPLAPSIEIHFPPPLKFSGVKKGYPTHILPYNHRTPDAHPCRL